MSLHLNSSNQLSAILWILGFVCLLPGPARAEESSEQTPAPRLEISILDVAGKTHHLGCRPERKALAIVVLSTECPIARGYIPELNRLSARLQGENAGVDLFGVISDPSITRDQAAKYADEYRPEFPMLFDGSGDLAHELRPTHTPEAFVLDHNGTLVYRGRIDDTYVGLGKRREKASKHDLADAIEAALNRRAPTSSRTEPVGCRFEPRRHTDEKAAVTYTRDIAPLLQANCMNCHREGEVAPFSLTSYEDAAKRAGQLVDVTRTRFMPPWRPEPEFGHLLGERRLTQRQVEMIAQWAETGAPLGDPTDLTPAPKFSEGWLLGEPDLIVKMPEPYELAADGRDVFRNFVIPLDVGEDKLVAAAEFRPGNRRIVHHALFYLDSNGAAGKKDEADPGPGYGSFGGPGFVPTGALGGWAPGGTPAPLPDDMGRYLRKGSDLVLQVHYHPTGRPESDQSTIGIHFVKNNSKKVVAGLMVLDRGLTIPAGEKAHPMAGSYTLPANVTLVGITPHMHLLGREMKAVATLPDGRTEPLIWIKDWNFNWQDQYLFAEPLRLPKGTRLDVNAVYDNSEGNPLNPNAPPKQVTWGEQTTDEMFICFFLATTDRPQDLMGVVVDNLQSIGRQGAQRLRDRILNR